MSKNSNSEQTNSNNSKNVQNRTTQIPASKKSEPVKEGKKIDDLKNNLKNVAHNFKIKELENENRKLEEKIKDLENRNLRLYADIDNVHKQNSIDLPRYKKMGKESVLSPVLNFLSTLHIAFNYAPKTEDEGVQKYIETLKNSFEKIKKELKDLNIEIIEPKIGEKFDANVMRSLNGAENQDAKVMNVVSLGLKIDGVLSYPANVMIQ